MCRQRSPIHLLAVALASALVAATPAMAQTNPNNNASDVTGPNVTGGDVAGGAFTQPVSTGTTPALASPAVQSAVVAATARVVGALTLGSLSTLSGVSISPQAQAQVLAVITDGSPTSPPATALSTTLAAAGSGAAAVLPALMANLAGLESHPSRLAPAIGSYNEFVSHASAAFLMNAPPQFLAVQSVLGHLSVSAAAAK